MKKNALKLTAIAAGAVVLAGTAFAAPSFAHSKGTSVKAASSTGTTATWSGTSGDALDGRKVAKAPHVHASVAATITGLPTTITDLHAAGHTAVFLAYAYTGTAPTTQPTTGGRPAKFKATAIANGTVTGTLELDAPKTAGTYTVAIYNSKTSTTPVLVTIVVAADLTATATASAALTSAYDATITAPVKGDKPGKGKGKGGHGHGPKGGAGWTPTAAPTAPTV